MVHPEKQLVFIPAPGAGHIMSTVEIARLLVNRDPSLSITVLVIRPLLDSGLTNYIESLADDGAEGIRFVQLPHDESQLNPNPKSPMTALGKFINSHCKRVRELVADMVCRPGSGRLAGFVVDMFCTAMMDVADEFNIPTYVFFTSNAAFLGLKLHVEALCADHDHDGSEFRDSDAEIPVPSFVKPVPTTAFPSMMQSKEGLDFVVSSARRLRRAKAIMVNTFVELEPHAVRSLSLDATDPPVYPVGPVLNLRGGVEPESDNDVVRWLDGHPPSSVVFLCFGSMGSFEEVQVKEIAYALERSGHRFLWSLRRPPPPDRNMQVPGAYEDPGVVLPEGFLERTVETGKVIGWAPQAAVLSHHAVGGFVSHCGWNSLLESLWFGVPTAAWPMFAEQQMNAFEMVVELGLATEIRMDYKKSLFEPESLAAVVTWDEIENGITRLMTDNETRRKVKEMSEKSRAAVAEGGSSYDSLDVLVREFVSNVS